VWRSPVLSLPLQLVFHGQRTELELAWPSLLNQNFLHILKVAKIAHRETDKTTMFISVAEAGGSSFTARFQFSRLTHTKHLKGEFFEYACMV
jgi:hypothetical protein